jgi:predicted glycoside hydrolase/deacetylase ChbG (UPF0249 family)
MEDNHLKNKVKLIFNGDDFGLSKGVNLGIIETHQNGPVNSTTIMAGGDAFDHAVTLAGGNPDLSVGVHLTLTAIQSVGGVYRTITDEGGKFLSLQSFIKNTKEGLLDFDEIKSEYEAQIQKVINAGIQPSHFDSHHHTHNHPEIIKILLVLMKKYGVKGLRQIGENMLSTQINKVRTTDYFEQGFYEDKISFNHLKEMIEDFKGSSMEIMVHPAYIDNALCKLTSYHQKRMIEMETLASNELMEFLTKGSYEVTSFSKL